MQNDDTKPEYAWEVCLQGAAHGRIVHPQALDYSQYQPVEGRYGTWRCMAAELTPGGGITRWERLCIRRDSEKLDAGAPARSILDRARHWDAAVLLLEGAGLIDAEGDVSHEHALQVLAEMIEARKKSESVDPQ